MATSGQYGRGEVVIAPIPYALAEGGSAAGKLRPALIIAVLSRGDLLVCQITSQEAQDSFDVPLGDADFASGGLRKPSHIRASRLFIIRNET